VVPTLEMLFAVTPNMAEAAFRPVREV